MYIHDKAAPDSLYCYVSPSYPDSVWLRGLCLFFILPCRLEKFQTLSVGTTEKEITASVRKCSNCLIQSI